MADWGSVPDWISSIANVGVAVAAVVAARQGLKSLSAWRSETVGRRKIELAEEALSDFYEAQDLFSWVRSPMSYAYEAEGRQGRDDEPENVRQLRDTYFATVKRLTDRADFIGKVRARRYRIAATFGPEAIQPYQTLGRIHAEITSAAHSLLRLNPARIDDAAQERRERWEAVIWDGVEEDDQMTRRITSMVDVAERTFRPEIEGR